MFAKLFDHISVRSLVNALVFTTLLLASVFFFDNKPLRVGFFGNIWFLPLWLSQALALVIPLLVGLIFNEYINRRRLFTGQNHLLVSLGLLVYTTLLSARAFEGLVLLPLALFFFYKLSQLTEVKYSKYLSFDIGLTIGFFSLLYQPLIVLYPIQLVLTLFQGKLSGRALVAGILGLSAGITFPAFVCSWFKINLLALWFEGIQKVGFSFSPYGLLSLWALVPLAVLLLLCFQRLPVMLSRANNQQRVTFSFWYLSLVCLLLPLLLATNKVLWMVFFIIPLAWVISKVLSESTNRWFRDGLYILLLSAVALQVQGLLFNL